MGKRRKSMSLLATALTAVLTTGGVFPYMGSLEEIWAAEGRQWQKRRKQGII